jgi:hypothetical protein
MSEDRVCDTGNSTVEGVVEQGREDLAALVGYSGHTFPKNEVTICEIITFPILNPPRAATIYARSTGASALILEFPAPRWQRNASSRG